MIQFRNKAHNAKNEQKQLTQAIQAQCRDYNIPFIINDDVALAVVMDAVRVHLGKNDMSMSEVRRYLGANKYIGVSFMLRLHAQSAHNKTVLTMSLLVRFSSCIYFGHKVINDSLSG